MPVLVPRAELRLNTAYLFLMDGASVEDDGSGYPFRITFTTGSGPVSTPPPVPQLVSIKASASSEASASGRYRSVSRSLALHFDQNAGILIFGVLDLAGNFSGWAAMTQLVLPSREEVEASTPVLPDPPVAPLPAPEQSTGCTLSPQRSTTAGSSWPLLALAAGLAYARLRSTGARRDR